MRNLIAALLRYRPLMIMLLAAWLLGGFILFLRLDIEAYPDPSPPLVEVITQNPSWSAEEMEQQVTVPVETALFGIPHLEDVRSISIFGLSDVKMYFGYDSDYYRDRQEVLNRLQLIRFPTGFHHSSRRGLPSAKSIATDCTVPVTLNELKATHDWFVTREIKQVPGIIDVTSFGGSTRQYIAEIDPRKLLQYNLTLPQVVTAVGQATLTRAETTFLWAARPSMFAASACSTTFRRWTTSSSPNATASRFISAMWPTCTKATSHAWASRD